MKTQKIYINTDDTVEAKELLKWYSSDEEDDIKEDDEMIFSCQYLRTKKINYYKYACGMNRAGDVILTGFSITKKEFEAEPTLQRKPIR